MADSPVDTIWVDDVSAVAPAVAAIRSLARGAIAVDLEGVDLGRTGEVCIVQIAVARSGAPIYLFDICALGGLAFEGDASLRGLFTDGALDLLMFDARADANALFFHFDVRLSRVVDLQLLDVAHRLVTGLGCRSISGLGYLVERTQHCRLTEAERERMSAIKAAAHELFVPERGGSYAVWKERPLPRLLLEYCTDAALFFSLRESFEGASLGRFGDACRAALDAAVRRRLDWAESEVFDKSDRERLIAIDDALRADLDAIVGGLPHSAAGGYRGRGRGFPRGRGRGGWHTATSLTPPD